MTEIYTVFPPHTVTPGLVLRRPFHCLISWMKRFYVYILASRKNGTLYTGMTNDIARRAWEHRTGAVDGFTKRHSMKRLVYIEELATARDAIRPPI